MKVRIILSSNIKIFQGSKSCLFPLSYWILIFLCVLAKPEDCLLSQHKQNKYSQAEIEFKFRFHTLAKYCVVFIYFTFVYSCRLLRWSRCKTQTLIPSSLMHTPLEFVFMSWSPDHFPIQTSETKTSWVPNDPLTFFLGIFSLKKINSTYFSLQLIYRIGRGYIRPDHSKVRSDCPKALKRLYLDCIRYNREERPQFKQVCFLCFFLETDQNDFLGNC